MSLPPDEQEMNWITKLAKALHRFIVPAVGLLITPNSYQKGFQFFYLDCG